MHNKYSKTALLSLAMVAPSLALANGRITSVSVAKLDNGVEVLINGAALNDPEANFAEAGTVYTLNFDATLEVKPSKTQIWMNGLEFMQSASVGKKKSSFRFKFTNEVNATVIKTPFGVRIFFAGPEARVAIRKAPASNFKPLMETSRVPAPKGPIGTLVAAGAPRRTLPKVSFTPEPIAQNVQRNTAAQGFAPISNSTATKVSAVKGEDSRVSLDFVNTEIVHILKSLAMQTRVNIVTSPDVNGKLSVKLNNVSVKEALNLVTSLSGLKFAQVGKTYVVTTQGKFLETLRSVQGPKDEFTLSRVVPIYSGQGNQIKIAVLKSIAAENGNGRFELVLPSEKTVISNVEVSGNATADGDKKQSMLKTESDEKGVDTYMMVIGSPSRIDEVEQLVKGIDRQLCTALGVKVPENNASIIESYTVHGGRAQDLVDAIAGKGKSTLGSVELFATPSNSIAKQTIVLKGREDEVRQIIGALSQLDSDESARLTEFQIVDLMYSDPRAAREMIVAQVPGISVTIAPNGVLNPGTFMPDQVRMQSEQRGTDQPAPQGGGSPMAMMNQQGGGAGMGMGMAPGQAGGAGGAGMGQGITAGKEQADSGFVFPFANFEQFGMPMRLIMKGSKEQIERAVQLIKAFDTAPKQVALEMRVMEISRQELLKLGIDWNLFTSGAIKTIRLNNANTGPQNSIGVSVQGRDISGDVGATLDAISNSSNLISRPNLICNDGRGNEVFVGDAIRYIESIISSQNGPSVTTGTVRAGVRLAVFPRIGGDTVNLDLQTSVTYLRGFKAVPQIGGELPQTSERISGNSITLKDGETFAIGGLIQEQVRKELAGLPILKDLPVLGQFFRRTTDDRIKTELVIFVTAKIVSPGKDKSDSLPMSSDTVLTKSQSTFTPKVNKKGGSN